MCRVAGDLEQRTRHNRPRSDASSINLTPRAVSLPPASGRWPANVILDEEAGRLLDEQSGITTTAKRNGDYDTTKAWFGGGKANAGNTHGDTGGASRFFYCAKTSKKERDAGLDDFEEEITRSYEGGQIISEKTSARGGRRTSRNTHPTVKPIALMRYLIRLVTPPGGTVLDPFLGSGSTGCAAALEPAVEEFIGCELEQHSLDIATARIAHWQRQADKEASGEDAANEAA